MARFKQQVVSLKNEKEVLMARLVVAESRIESRQVKTEEKQEKEMFDNTSLIVSSEETKSDDTDLKERDLSTKTQTEETMATLEPDESVQPVQSSNVTVEKLNINHQSDNQTLTVEVKLRNIGPKTEPVSGDVVVVLKDDEVKMDHWITVPAGAVVAGKLPRNRKGHTFSIYRFVTLKFKVEYQTSPHIFKIATVYVFSKEGELLFIKDFPISIKSALVPIPKNDYYA